MNVPKLGELLPPSHTMESVEWLHAVGWLSLLLLFCHGVYNKYFHPFANIPGPFLAAVSPLWMMRAVYGKKLNRDVKKLHDQYGMIDNPNGPAHLKRSLSGKPCLHSILRIGDVVRLGPSTLSFAALKAQQEVHNSRTPDGKYFTKFGTIEWLLGAMAWPALNILTTTDAEAHKSLRKAVQPAFTLKEHRKQAPILRKWTTSWIQDLQRAAADGVEINITASISQLVWDQLGDLAFGEPLAKSQLGMTYLIHRSPMFPSI